MVGCVRIVVPLCVAHMHCGIITTINALHPIPLVHLVSDVVEFGNVLVVAPAVSSRKVVECGQPIGAVVGRDVENDAFLSTGCSDDITDFVFRRAVAFEVFDGSDPDGIDVVVIPFHIVAYRTYSRDDDCVHAAIFGGGPVPIGIGEDEGPSANDPQRCVYFVDVGQQPSHLSCGGKIPAVVEVDGPCGWIPIGSMRGSDDGRVLVTVHVVQRLSGEFTIGQVWNVITVAIMCFGDPIGVESINVQIDGPTLCASVVDIKDDTFGSLSRCCKLLWPDGAAIGAKDVADADVLSEN